MTSLGARLLQGAASGLAATAAMSAQMIAMPSTDRIGTPPPRRLADALLAGHSARDRRIAATLIHLGIGAASGAVYGSLRRRGGPFSGVVFGAAIWAIGYELAVPATGVLPVAHRDRPARRAALIEAHLVYGAILGVLNWI